MFQGQEGENGTEIHPEFTFELKEEGKKGGFSAEECQKGIRVGLKQDEAQFAKGLVNKGYIISEEKYRYGQEKEYDHNKKEELKNDYVKDGGNIHPDFARRSDSDRETYRKKGKNNLYNTEDKEKEVKQLIKLGFKLKESEIIGKGKVHSFSASEIGEWLSIGLKKEDGEFAYVLKKQGYSPELVKNNVKELRNIYRKKSNLIRSTLSKRPKKGNKRIRF